MMEKFKKARGKKVEVERKKEEKPKKKRTIEMKKIAEEWEIWYEEKETAKSKEEAKNWHLKYFTNRFIFLKRKQVRECQ